jgi:hypothetical protein
LPHQHEAQVEIGLEQVLGSNIGDADGFLERCARLIEARFPKINSCSARSCADSSDAIPKTPAKIKYISLFFILFSQFKIFTG